MGLVMGCYDVRLVGDATGLLWLFCSNEAVGWYWRSRVVLGGTGVE